MKRSNEHLDQDDGPSKRAKLDDNEGGMEDIVGAIEDQEEVEYDNNSNDAEMEVEEEGALQMEVGREGEQTEENAAVDAGDNVVPAQGEGGNVYVEGDGNTAAEKGAPVSPSRPVVLSNDKSKLIKSFTFICSVCNESFLNEAKIIDQEIPDFVLCLPCFSSGKEAGLHLSGHKYSVEHNLNSCRFFSNEWGANEELLLLEGCDLLGFGNWKDISEHIGTKDEKQCADHYSTCFIASDDLLPTPPPPAAEVIEEEVLAEEEAANADGKSVSRGGNTKKKFPVSTPVQTASSAMKNKKAESVLPGYMPLRDDFDVEHDNDAELILSDMQFNDDDLETERELKIKIVQIYNRKLDERERRKTFVLERGLLDYRKQQHIDRRRPKEEREIYNLMRVFARFQTPEEHEAYVQGLIKELNIRKRIAQLQEYRKMGIRSLAEAEIYEIDKKRRENQAAANARRYNSSYVIENVKPMSGTGSGAKGSKWRNRGGDTNNDNDDKDDGKIDFSADDEFSLLSAKEQELCSTVNIPPKHYLVMKTTLLQESMKLGFVEKDRASQVLNINVSKSGKIYDFFVTAGWVKGKDVLE